MLRIEETPDGIVFVVRVQPRAKKNELVGILEDALKIRLTAPPVEGAANELCRKFLAKTLDIPPSHVSLLSGLHSRQKRVCIRGMRKAEFLQRLKSLGLYPPHS
ncbi:MAG: YggU family protein [Nitrospinota bacterium]|nr:MAG: YggU family protein [Nitrospinota bacterium]